MSEGDLISIKHVELILEAFKRLKQERRSASTLWEFGAVRHKEEWLQGYEIGDLEQAFHDLTVAGLASQVSQDYYEVTNRGSKAAPAEVARYFLKNRYDDTKNSLNGYRSRTRLAWIVRYLALLFAIVFVILLFGQIAWRMDAIYWQVPGLVFATLFLVSIGFTQMSAWFWRKHDLTNEKDIAVNLLDAYDLNSKGRIDEAEKIVRRISGSLEPESQPTYWSTVDREFDNLSKIGQDIRTRILPMLKDRKTSSREHVEEILVRLACLFFEGSSESMKRVPVVYQALPIPGTPSAVPISTRVRGTLASSFARTIIALIVAMALVYAIVWEGATITGTPFVPNPMNLLTAAGVVAGIALVVRYILPGQKK